MAAIKVANDDRWPQGGSSCDAYAQGSQSTWCTFRLTCKTNTALIKNQLDLFLKDEGELLYRAPSARVSELCSELKW